MRKITFFMLALFCAVASWAQGGTAWVVDTDANNLITSADQLSSPCSDPSEGQNIGNLLDDDPVTFWHSAWQGDASNWAAGTHYFQVNAPDLPEYFGFEFTRRNNSGNQITKWGVFGAPYADASKEECTLLAEVETPFSSQTETLVSPVINNSQGFKILRFYNHSGNVFFHLAEFRLLPCKAADEIEVALYALQAVYDTYTAKALDPENLGDKPGQYSEKAYAEFEGKIEDAGKILDAGTDCGCSKEEIEAAGEAIKEAWAAVEASRVPFQQEIKPGYYVIKSALDFYKTVTIPAGTDEATGEDVPETTKKVYFEKAIYADRNVAKWKTFEEKAAFLFKIEATDIDRAYVVKNALTGMTWNTIGGFTDQETDAKLMFDWSMENIEMFADSTEHKVIPIVYNIRFSTSSEDKGNTGTFIHAGGHGGGTGNAGNIVSWSCPRDVTDGSLHPCATDWYLQPVDEATVQDWLAASVDIREIQAMIDSVNVIKNAFPAQKTIAVDKVTVLDKENPLITAGSQFSSPFTTHDGQETTDEQIFANLINEEGTTYWHSRWEDGNANPGTHYLEVADIPADAADVAFEITRRPVGNDHPAVLSVYGFDEHNAELTKEQGTLLATCRIGYTSNTETKVSDVFNTQGKTVLRFYNEESAPISYNRGYWHCKKFQLYPAVVSYGATTTQAVARASELSDVESAIKAWNEGNFTEESSISDVQSAYNDVVNAYAAWTAVFTNPAPLRDAVAEATEFSKGIVEGKNPGQWPAGAGSSVIGAAVEAAQAYNNTGMYTTDGMEEQIAAIAAAKTQVAGMANPVEIGKWYAIRFATEDEYEANGWDKTQAESKTQGNLYNNYVAPAGNIEGVVEDDVVTSLAEHPIIENEDVRKGTALRFTEATPSVDNIAFRFVKLGDNLALQHASGWFVGTDGNLTNLPALFSTEAIGYGKSLIKVRNLAGEDVVDNGGGTPSYLHAQVAAHKLVAWAADAIDSRSALYIEEVDGNVQVGTELVEEVRTGTTHFLTFPLDLAYDVNSNVQLYDFKGYEKTATGVKVAFDKIDKAQAGKACLLVVDGDLSETPTAADTVEVNFTLDATNFAAQPDSTQALVGTYTYQWVEEEKMPSTITIYQNVMQMANGLDATECARDIWAFEGAIDLLKAQAIENIDGDLVIELEGEFDTDAIQDVIANAVNANGKIYTLDGRCVGKGNLGTVRNLGRGIYIVNGVKIAVK